MIKPCVYYRVSTSKQDFESQREKIESYLRFKDFNPEDVPCFYDKGSGMDTHNRPQFMKMIKACHDGEFDTVICYKLDRLSRSSNHLIRLVLELDEISVGFVCVTQLELNLEPGNPFRGMIIGAFAGIAQLERETIVERIKDGLEKARRRGVKLGRPGKVNDQVLNKILYMRSTGNFSNREIARALQLHHSTVNKIINDIEMAVEPILPPSPNQ